MFMACAAISADSASPICPAAARSRDPVRAPPRTSATETPARRSSASASAACIAEKTVSCPALIAASPRAFCSLAVALATAPTPDMDASNSMYAFADMASTPPMAAPPMAAAPAALFQAPALASMEDAPVLAMSVVAVRIRATEAR